MNKIAIFVSGAGVAAERIVKLFNEGNRVKTVLVFTDDSAVSLADRLQGEDVTTVHIPDYEWQSRSEEIVELLKANEVSLLVLDHFESGISGEILEATAGKLISVTTPEEAPREVVAALERGKDSALNFQNSEEAEEEKEAGPESRQLPPTPEKEWADALKIRFTPPEVPMTPPEVPVKNEEPIVVYEVENKPVEIRNEGPRRKEHEDVMPSTWMIWSILVTVFCCFIPGIVAIVFSSQVSSRYFAGDIEGSRRASRMAEIWIIVSFVLGVLSATLYLPFMML